MTRLLGFAALFITIGCSGSDFKAGFAGAAGATTDDGGLGATGGTQPVATGGREATGGRPGIGHGSGGASSGGSGGTPVDGAADAGSAGGSTGGEPSTGGALGSGGVLGSGGSSGAGGVIGTGGSGPVCLTDLSGVGTGDFSIHFTLTTTESGLTIGLLNQRTGCDCTSPTFCNQPSTFWDVSLNPTAGIVAVTDDGIAAHYAFVEAGNSLNDGKPHKVDVIRRGGMLWYASDGTIRSTPSPDPYSFGTFPPLVRGSSACAGTIPAAGHATILDVCFTEP